MNKTIYFKRDAGIDDIPCIYAWTPSYDWSINYPGVAMEQESTIWFKYTINNAPDTEWYFAFCYLNQSTNIEGDHLVTTSDTEYLDSSYNDVSSEYVFVTPPVIDTPTIPPSEEESTIISKAGPVYLVCFKGTNIKRSIFDRLVRIFTKTKYTHVGLTSNPEGETITYYAARYDGGVNTYTESASDVDLYLIHLKNGVGINEFYNATKGQYGSFVKDINRWDLANTPISHFDLMKTARDYWRHPDKSEPGWGSVEWTAAALHLGLPHRYTIDKLIEFANME